MTDLKSKQVKSLAFAWEDTYHVPEVSPDKFRPNVYVFTKSAFDRFKEGGHIKDSKRADGSLAGYSVYCKETDEDCFKFAVERILAGQRVGIAFGPDCGPHCRAGLIKLAKVVAHWKDGEFILGSGEAVSFREAALRMAEGYAMAIQRYGKISLSFKYGRMCHDWTLELRIPPRGKRPRWSCCHSVVMLVQYLRLEPQTGVVGDNESPEYFGAALANADLEAYRKETKPARSIKEKPQ